MAASAQSLTNSSENRSVLPGWKMPPMNAARNHAQKQANPTIMRSEVISARSSRTMTGSNPSAMGASSEIGDQ